MKKRALTLALVLAMCLSLAIPAFAADEGTVSDPDTTAAPTESAEPTESEPVENTEDKDDDAEPSEPAEGDDENAEPSEPAEGDDENAEPSDPVEPAPAIEFTDVPEGIWYDEPVKWAVEKKITNGTEDTKFSPDVNCSQVQILTFLYRAVQSAEDPDFAPAATDLDAATEWAKEKEMIDDSFVASADCTRATAASYIWQAFGSEEVEANDAITDVDEADLAAVTWMLAQKITNGTSEDPFLFSPDQVCTRGEIVTFLYRAYNPVQSDAPAEPAE